MSVRKYTNLYTGAQAERPCAPTKEDQSKDKREIEQLKEAIANRFKDTEEVKKAARIIEEMLNR